MLKVIYTFIRFITLIGTQSVTESQERRYVRQLNRLALLIATIIFVLLFPSLAMLPNSWLMVVITSLFPVFCSLVFVANHLKKFTLARIYFIILSQATIVCTSIWMGGEAFNQIYLLSVAVGAFYIFPIRQTRYAVAISTVSIALLLSLEAFFDYAPYNGALSSAEQQITRYISIFGFALMLCLMALQNFLTLNRAEEHAQNEHNRSEKVLGKIFPKHITEQLKKNESGIIAERFDKVSVMFIDIVGFTELSSRCTPENLVSFLDEVFGNFDQIAKVHSIEKIKSIGDAYLLASGLNKAESSADSDMNAKAQLFAIIDCALQLVQFLKSKKYLINGSEVSVKVRIGIHIGPVVAGVFGEQKFSYDVWGDTVNTSQRMETHGKDNHIHVSKEVINYIYDEYAYISNGKTIVKGKGHMETYYILSRNEDQLDNIDRVAS